MAKTPSVLLADDDTEDQDLLKEFLLKENPALTIHAVLNGKEAISWLQNRPVDELPSLIILDYKMPLLNAVETLERLKKDPRYEYIPKIVWSTSIQDEHKKICLENGAAKYFSKPTSSGELSSLSKQIIEIILGGKADKQ